MQQHLLSPALPSSSTDILPAPSPQAFVPSAYPDQAMTTAITTTTTVKRKRTDIPDTVSVTRPVVKKKKANRACIHCQKAHLTCDDCSCPVSTCCASFFFGCANNVIGSPFCSKTMSTLRQAWYAKRLHRRSPKEGQIPPRRGGTRSVFVFPTSRDLVIS